jgi:hypothetical protein
MFNLHHIKLDMKRVARCSSGPVHATPCATQYMLHSVLHSTCYTVCYTVHATQCAPQHMLHCVLHSTCYTVCYTAHATQCATQHMLHAALQSVRSEDDDEFVVLQKPIAEIRRAFGDMRGRSV